MTHSPSRNQSGHTAEQDSAAGGREQRLIKLDQNRIAAASIALRHFDKSRRIYAYLRFKSQGKTIERYVGDVTASTRAAALQEGWKLARRKGLTKCPPS